jgi:hypothetical protein
MAEQRFEQIAIIYFCTSKRELDLTGCYDSKREYNSHQNNNIRILAHFNTMAELVWNLIQCQASQYLHPNAP